MSTEESGLVKIALVSCGSEHAESSLNLMKLQPK